jgi:tetraacyldisaccharide 4'-kinase
VNRASLAAEVWESGATGARLARLALTPLGWLYGGVVRLRNRLFDLGVLPSHRMALPALSVGNLTVGGTGKTPIAAWLVGQLRAAGARPAIVLRGYGGDEPLVHERLNPGVPVIVDPDRVRGTRAAAEAGATVVVLDDAFQHRRARRDADIVLLSADRFGPVRSLPAGPWREPLSSLKRAAVVVVTHKQASVLRARELLSHALRFAPDAEGVIIHLAPDALVAADGGEVRPLRVVSGEPVLLISAIGDPRALEGQLRAAGARVEAAAYPDHHAFDDRDVAALVARAKGVTWVICTLKDAVKLGPLWPRGTPSLWYLSQRVIVEAGQPAFDAVVARFAAMRTPERSTTPA